MRRYSIRATMLCLLMLSLSGVVRAGDNIIEQKKELEDIRREMQQSQDRLDSLKNAQFQVQSEISEYDQQISSDRKIINRLTGELNQLGNKVTDAEVEVSSGRIAFERTQRRYLGNLRQLYLAARDASATIDDDPNRELEMHRRVVYLTALTGFESGNVNKASQMLAQSTVQLQDLTGRQSMVNKLKKKTEVNYSLGKSQKQRQEKALDRLRHSSMQESERIMTLQQAAEEMERILARLESQRRRESPGSIPTPETSAFAALKGNLPPPFRGKIVVPFGPSQDPVTRLRSYSPGVSIKGRARASVYTVGSGTVAYVGELRGYEKFVIINHDNLYYTTYAGLGKVVVTQGQHLQVGTQLGQAGEDGVVKFELRQGREPLDPVKWIDIDAL